MIGKKTKEDAGDIHKHARQIYKDVWTSPSWRGVQVSTYNGIFFLNGKDSWSKMEKKWRPEHSWLLIGTLKTLNKMLFYWNQRVDSFLVELYQGHNL